MLQSVSLVHTLEPDKTTEVENLTVVHEDSCDKDSYDDDNVSICSEYEVEEILETKVTSSGRLFQVNWLNYGSSENTWEHEENLACPELISAFNQKQRQKRSQS